MAVYSHVHIVVSVHGLRLHLTCCCRQVYVAPGQWSLPLNLPNEWLGIFPAGELADDDTTTPWGDEIEQKVLLPPQIGG